MIRENTAIYTAYDEHRAFDPAAPEKTLLLAVLRTALEDIKKRGEVYRDARRYFLSEDWIYPFSFLNVCYYLNLSPTTIRSRLGLQGESSFSDRHSDRHSDRIAA